MKKVLFTATVDGHIKAFHLPYLKYFKDNGYEVHVAANGTSEIPYCDVKHYIPFSRSPFSIENVRAYKALKFIIDKFNYSLIHCHTPVGGVVTRLAARNSRKKGTKVLYTAHGFHFYKGAPLLNWVIYYPIETLLSKYTDGLITINNEDFQIAKKCMNCKVYFTHGVGVDQDKFNPKLYNKALLRDKHHISLDAFVLTCVAELNRNKNQEFLIKSIPFLNKDIPNIILLLAGTGNEYIRLSELINNMNLHAHVRLLGYRSDIPELLALSDVVVSSSQREGLPINILEGIFMGLPAVVTDIRGHRDIINTTEQGFLYSSNNCEHISTHIKDIYYGKVPNIPIKNITAYSLSNVVQEITEIYKLFS